MLLVSDDLYSYFRRYFNSTDITIGSVSIKNATMKEIGTTVSYCVGLTVRTPAMSVASLGVRSATRHNTLQHIQYLWSV